MRASGATVDVVLRDLDTRHSGLRFRMVDEQGRLRRHTRVFVNREIEPDLGRRLDAGDEVVLMQALSGGT